MKDISNQRLKKIWEFSKQVYRSYLKHQGTKQAAALAYFGLFSIFPLMLFLVYLGSFFISSEEIYNLLSAYLREVFPAGANNLIQILDQTLNTRGSIGLVSIVGLLWSGSSVFGVLETALNDIWDSPSRTFWQRRGLAAVSVVILGVAFLASFFLGPLMSWLLSGGILDGELSSFLTEFVVLTLVGVLLYRIFPNKKVRWEPALLGAIIGAGFLVAARIVFSVYITLIISRYGLIYGSLARFLLLALWVYLVGVLMLLGAEFAAAFQKQEIV